TYYVDTNHPSASDSNPGTEVLPWKTIQKPANMLVAGDTVYIKQGTYAGFVSAKNSGTASGWITYSAYPGHEHKAILDGSPFEIRGKSYIRLFGLRVQNVNTGSWNGIDIIGPGSNITISSNYTYNTKGSGISGWGALYKTTLSDSALTDLIIENNKVELANNGGWNENITLSNGVDRFEIRNNELWSNSSQDATNGGEGIDVKFGVRNGKIYGNYVHDLKRIGIYVDAFQRYATNIEIYNNRVNNTLVNTATGITVGKEGVGGVVDGIKIYNNTVSGWGRSGIDLFPHFLDDGKNMRNITIINNTTYNNGAEPGHGGAGIVVNYPTATNVTVRNNIAYKNIDWQLSSNVGTVDHNLITDPHFVNEAARDFHLKSTSPAINTGSSVGAPTTDYDGKARPQGSALDIGAYEVCSGTCSGGGGGDTTPPTVSIAAPANGATVSGTVTVSANASDNVGVTSVAFKVDGTTFLTDTAAPYSMSWNTTSVSEASHALTAVASDAAGNTTTSSAVTVTVDNVPASDTTPPSNPTGLTATAISSSQINLAWTASTDNVGVTGYRVERCQGSGCTNFTQVATPTGTTYSDTGLAASTLYQYRVRAADAAGNLSGYPTSAGATTQGRRPPPSPSP
ncbi:MAG: Ig-like domain-containing protein, partial [Gammaproteobacteria bacterium]